MKLIYHDKAHKYYLDGKPCQNISSLASRAKDSFHLQKWQIRQTGIGLARYPDLVQHIAANIDDRDAVDAACLDAQRLAGAFDASERGTAMHTATELHDKGEGLQPRQVDDATAWQRTLDAYGIEVKYVEGFAVYPEYRVAGRYDRFAMFEGRLVDIDLKSGFNAVRYPESTAVQQALYVYADQFSMSITRDPLDDTKFFTSHWAAMPDIDKESAYVLLLPPGAEIGRLHRLNIKKAWPEAKRQLESVEWRREVARVDSGFVQEIAPENEVVELLRKSLDAVELTLMEQIANTRSVKELEKLFLSHQKEWTQEHTNAASAQKQKIHTRSLRWIGSGAETQW